MKYANYIIPGYTELNRMHWVFKFCFIKNLEWSLLLSNRTLKTKRQQKNSKLLSLIRGNTTKQIYDIYLVLC